MLYITRRSEENERAEQIVEFVDWLGKQSNGQMKVKYEVVLGDHQTAFPVTGIKSIAWIASLQD